MQEWTDEQYVKRAKKEPERIKFWLPYSKSYIEACRSVCDNPPRFDDTFKKVFPTPQSLFKFQEELDAERNNSIPV